MGGKTGSAQAGRNGEEITNAWFVGFAPYDDPEVAMAVRITNGYTSGNAISVANDIFSYMYNLEDESAIVSGTASIENISSEQTD